MSWFTLLIEPPKNILKSDDSGSPEGLWVKCPNFSEALYNKELTRNAMVCSKCNQHLRMSALQRAELLFDAESFEELDTELRSLDPLNFKDKKKYKDRTKEAVKKAGTEDAVRNYIGEIQGRTVSASLLECVGLGGRRG